MEWEQREVELERIIHNMERMQAEIAGAANQFEQAVSSLPDPNWPVAKQLEHAISTIKGNVKVIMDAKGEAQVYKKVRRLGFILKGISVIIKLNMETSVI